MHGFLRQNGRPLQDVFDRDLTDVPSIPKDPAFARFGEMRKELDERALDCAGRIRYGIPKNDPFPHQSNKIFTKSNKLYMGDK